MYLGKLLFQTQTKLKGQPERIINGHIGEHDPELEPVLDIKSSPLSTRASQRPASMYETREGLRKPPSYISQVGL